MKKLVSMISILFTLSITMTGCTMESPRMTFNDDLHTIPGGSGWSYQQITGYSNFEWRTNISSGDNPEWNVLWMEESECGNWMIGDPHEIINELIFQKKNMINTNGAQELLSTWELNVQSWLNYSTVPRLIIKYEDLQLKPKSIVLKIRDFLNTNQNNKYRLEVVSLRDSKTAEAIIVELNVTGL